MHVLGRRGFIGSSLAAFGIAQARAASNYDMIIVGAGTAGMPAAVFASQRGANVLLIEAADRMGGTLNIAGGEISGAGTYTQKAKGIKDHPDIHFDDVMRLTNGFADPAVVRRNVDTAGATINWLLDLGLTPLPDHPISGTAPGRPGYSVARYLWGEHHGRDLVTALEKAIAPEIKSGRVALQLETRVTGLLTNDKGAVEGVRASVGGKEVTFRGRNVILTSGGYAMNPVMFEQMTGKPAFVANSYPTSQGDGLALALSVGGAVRNKELHRPGTGSVLDRGTWPTKVYVRYGAPDRPPWEIWVNGAGQRFINEEEPSGNLRERALLKQPRLRYAIVFDQGIFDAAPVGVPKWTHDDLAVHFANHPMFLRADTLEKLALKAEIDPAGLKASVAAYNAGVKNGTADPMGRQHRPRAIETGPFYAVIHHGHSATSAAGVSIDKNFQAVRPSGEPIPGLYAAGEVLGSGATMGDAFAPGMMITPAMTLGRHLGLTLPVTPT